MSAENWAECPQCKENINKKYSNQIQKLQEDYGKISAEEFIKRTNELKNKSDLNADLDDMECSLGEYYEIGITDNMFFVDYEGHCSDCGFIFNFKKEIDITKEGTGK